MKIKELKARVIRDTRGDKTIEVSLQTDFGKFISSSPNGKSRGKFEAKPWKGKVESDVKTINNLIGEIEINSFDDLIKLEKLFEKKVGANSMIAIEYVFLKALAKKNKKQVWQLINSKAKKFPMPVGNAIGGGAHSKGQKPDFQEFQFIPMTSSFEKAVKINKRAHGNCARILKNVDKKFKRKLSDENAWQTTLSNGEVIKIMEEVGLKFKLKLGIDVAASNFYKNKKYVYKNNEVGLSKQNQIKFMNEIAKKFFYLEDPLEENDFLGFAKLKSKGLIVGDDLTVTNLSRIKKAHRIKSINAVIIKPNQCGSLIEVKNIVKFCKAHRIKTIFSHRSGETNENILADLAFGFQADFIKTGILGKGRDEKLKRLVEIEKG